MSYARKDEALAQQLTGAGFDVWFAEDEIVPGENWAKKIGKALDASELMVFLLTPGVLDSDSIRQNVEFAITSRRLEGRIFSVLVGSNREVGKQVPWILLKLPHCRVNSAKDFAKVVKEIRNLSSVANLSHSNA